MVSGILDQPTLVLNKLWQPVGVATVARSLVLVFNGTARVVDPHTFELYEWSDWAGLEPVDGEPVVRAVDRAFRVPEVISLAHYDRTPQASVSFSRRNIFKRDHYTCQYCGVQPGPDELTIDHVVPRSHGGQSTWENCVLACIKCNGRKADRTPDEAGMRLRHRPHRPRWQPLYANRAERIDSWAKFISTAYWNAELADS